MLFRGNPTICLRLALLERVAPALYLALGVGIGQIWVWFAAWWLVALSSLLIGIVLASRRSIWICSKSIAWGMALGISTALLGLYSHPSSLGGSDVILLVRVEEPPARRIPGEVTFMAREVLGPLRRTMRCRAVDLPWRHASDVRMGDVIWIRGVLTPVVRPVNPFSWQGWLWRRGVSGELKALFVSPALSRSETAIARLRSAIRSIVLGKTEQSRGGALLLSMALGDRDVLSSYVEDIFKVVGLSHLLVVSGYQVSLVFGVVFSCFMYLMRYIGFGVYPRNIATGGALACCAGYVALVGAEVSAVRALVAATTLCVGLVLDRKHRFIQRWSCALLFIEVIYPWALFDIGVLLTFAALGGIGLGMTIAGRSGVFSLVCVTLCVWVVTSTVTTIWIGSFSWLGMVLNLILPGPWSIWNCTVGGVVVILAELFPIIGDPLLQLVAHVNELVVDGLVVLAGAHSKPQEISPMVRWSMAAVLLAGTLSLIMVALKRHTYALMHEMAKRG